MLLIITAVTLLFLAIVYIIRATWAECRKRKNNPELWSSYSPEEYEADRAGVDSEPHSFI